MTRDFTMELENSIYYVLGIYNADLKTELSALYTYLNSHVNIDKYNKELEKIIALENFIGIDIKQNEEIQSQIHEVFERVRDYDLEESKKLLGSKNNFFTSIIDAMNKRIDLVDTSFLGTNAAEVKMNTMYRNAEFKNSIFYNGESYQNKVKELPEGPAYDYYKSIDPSTEEGRKKLIEFFSGQPGEEDITEVYGVILLLNSCVREDNPEEPIDTVKLSQIVNCSYINYEDSDGQETKGVSPMVGVIGSMYNTDEYFDSDNFKNNCDESDFKYYSLVSSTFKGISEYNYIPSVGDVIIKYDNGNIITVGTAFSIGFKVYSNGEEHNFSNAIAEYNNKQKEQIEKYYDPEGYERNLWAHEFLPEFYDNDDMRPNLDDEKVDSNNKTKSSKGDIRNSFLYKTARSVSGIIDDYEDIQEQVEEYKAHTKEKISIHEKNASLADLNDISFGLHASVNVSFYRNQIIIDNPMVDYNSLYVDVAYANCVSLNENKIYSAGVLEEEYYNLVKNGSDYDFNDYICKINKTLENHKNIEDFRNDVRSKIGNRNFADCTIDELDTAINSVLSEYREQR